MAAFMSAVPIPGTATDAQSVRPSIILTRYCQTKNCRNMLCSGTEDKLCEQCRDIIGSRAGGDTVRAAAEADDSLLQTGNLGLSNPQASFLSEATHDINWYSDRQSVGPAMLGAENDPYAAHLAMLDERQQNRARKLERETEEVDGRWRTRQSATALLGSSPPRVSRSRRPETDRGVAVAVDAYRPSGRYYLSEIDAYRPGRSSPAHAHRTSEIDRSYERGLRQVPKLDTLTSTALALRPPNKRKLQDEIARNEASNKSLANPSQSARCGKRQCNNMADIGKDRCKACYRAEGRHPEDERRRCASSNCTHCISDAIDGDLCRVCLDVELGERKRCNGLHCRIVLQKGDPDLLCLGCKRGTVPARYCKTQNCNALIPPSERGNHCKSHASAKQAPPKQAAKKTPIRSCSRPSCNNDIAANIPGKLCRVCLASHRETQFAKQQSMSNPLPVYQDYRHRMSYNDHPPRQFVGEPYQPQDRLYRQTFLDQSHQQNFQDQAYQQIFQTNRYQQGFQLNPMHDQYQRLMAPQLFQQQEPQFNPQPMLDQSHLTPQLSAQRYSHPSGRPQQIGPHVSHFPRQQLRQESVYRHDSPLAVPELAFDRPQLPKPSLDTTRSLSDISAPARHYRVTTMQRMLTAPCFGCLRDLGEQEASTHPQIYCIHLPSAIRQTVLLDYEQWKRICASGQQAEFDQSFSDVIKSERVEDGAAITVKRENEDGESLHPSSWPTVTEPRHSRDVSEQFVISGQHSNPYDTITNEPQSRMSQPAYPTETSGDPAVSVTSPSAAAASPHTNSDVAVGGLSKDWATDSIRELLELKAAAEPGTPLEVAVALQQELRNCLLLDVTKGDPQDGEPSAIGLLRVLDQRVETLRGGPADG
ncbi:uncharacterized protein RCC_06531 [Ramularia collo-cygni]|uniref:Uncharacterized protein n=1 Tax=Ramularia collo-cygni TaxID=112498 RepID=A0A2D3VIK8_9PEZI|nr:uncharacterized protein RCC_06531 [Ramularia collo-cygni]CZT20673.1 uncharacterized protein RCC_06531 [Ramularia collo-cygni]